MSRVATVNFTQYVDNDTFTEKELNFFAADGTTPLDLSDATAKIQIRKDSWNGRLYKTAIEGDGLEWTDQAQGEMTFGNWDTSVWGGAGAYFYDIQMTYATSGIVRTYVRGKIIMIDDSTQ